MSARTVVRSAISWVFWSSNETSIWKTLSSSAANLSSIAARFAAVFVFPIFCLFASVFCGKTSITQGGFLFARPFRRIPRAGRAQQETDRE